MKGVTVFLLLTLFSISCQKQVDYGPDIAQLKSDVTSLKSSISSITAQLTNLEPSLKTKIDIVNNRIDTISNSLVSMTSKTMLALSNDMLSIIATSIKSANIESTKKLDSIRTVVLKIDTIITSTTTPSLTLVNNSYNSLLTNYVEVLKIVKSSYAVVVITGKIEKGPFSKGSIISFYVLDSNLSQTGMSYSTTINDNQGNYELRASNISGKILRVQTDGFYYNEILNTLSTSRIILTGITKVDSSENENVNVLTHVERRRVEYLMTNNSMSFTNAKTQAITELLNLFKVGTNNITRSEKVSLFGNNNDILLNISLLFQGYRTDAQLSELLTDFSNDFYTDGTIEDVTIFKKIYNHSYFIDTLAVATNLQNKFNITPKSFSILTTYLSDNVSKKDESYMPITYPLISNSKQNFLTRIATETVSSSINGCLMYNKNDIPSFDFKVTIKSVNPVINSGIGSSSNVWFYSMGSGWSVTNFQFDNYGNQTYYTNNPVGEVSLQFGTGKYDLFYYEPASSANPTFVKRITVN